MARLNIEDSIYRDARFIKLIAKAGSLETALGILVRAWSVAQDWYLTPERMIPVSEWRKQELNDLLFDVGLATKVDEKIRVSGADEQFGWLLQKSEAGKKNRGSKKKPRTKSLNNSENGRQRTTSGDDGRRPLTLTLPLSPTLPQTQKTKELSEGQTPAEPPPQSSGQLFVGTYVKAYRKRYGEKARPDLGGKTQGGIKRLLADYPIDRACEMIQVFLQMDDPWFVTKAHDFETFAQNLTKVGLALDTGKERGGVSRWEQEMLDKEKKNDVSGISDSATAAQKLLR